MRKKKGNCDQANENQKIMRIYCHDNRQLFDGGDDDDTTPPKRIT